MSSCSYHTLSDLAPPPASTSSKVVVRKDMDLRQELFKVLSRVVNREGYRHFGMQSSTSHSLTLICRRLSMFLESLKPTFNPLDSGLPKSMPFTLCPAKGAESTCSILGFASGPKLPKDAHKLNGILAGSTTKIPDALRAKDFEARQHLQGLIFTHKFLRSMNK